MESWRGPGPGLGWKPFPAYATRKKLNKNNTTFIIYSFCSFGVKRSRVFLCFSFQSWHSLLFFSPRFGLQPSWMAWSGLQRRRWMSSGSRTWPTSTCVTWRKPKGKSWRTVDLRAGWTSAGRWKRGKILRWHWFTSQIISRWSSVFIQWTAVRAATDELHHKYICRLLSTLIVWWTEC